LNQSTDTPAFKAWFVRSKVVDDNGDPLVVYHGTQATFSVFDYRRIATNGRSEGAGFYFTTNRQVASGYGPAVQAFLSIQNPLAYNAQPFSTGVIERIVRRIAELEAHANGSGIADGFLSNFADVSHVGLASAVKQAGRLLASDQTALDQLSGLVGSGVSPQLVNQATYEVTGHDGVVAEGFSDCGDGANRIYVAFFPEQIKSADANDGSFDRDDTNILSQGSRAELLRAPLRAARQKASDVGTLQLNDDIRRVMDRLLSVQANVQENATNAPSAFSAAPEQQDYGQEDLEPVRQRMTA
jgi:hypothetical protein